MAVQDGYGKSSGSESLVFAYDLKDTVNSFRGEPATNSQNADISSMTQVGFDSWSCYDGSPPYHTWGTNQSKTFVTIPGPFGTSVNAMLYHNFNGGFYGPTDWGAVPNGTITAGRTYTVQGWVKAADSSSIGKTVTPYMYYSHSGGAYSAGTNYTLTDQWQLVSHTHTVQYNASGDGVMYFFTQNSGEVKMHLTMTGVFLDESHAVPWIIGGSTRSNTQGLLDLTGNNTIDLSNTSFDSNSLISLDGSNDYIKVQQNASLFGNDWTWEMVVKFNTNTGYYQGLVWAEGDTGGGSGLQYLFCLYGSSYFHYRISNTITGWGYTDTPTITFDPSQYNHIVWSFINGTTKIYINGSLFHTDTTRGEYAGGVNSPVFLGARNDGWGGSIINPNVFKRYNRALTSTEITNNYLKYKRQYGLT